MWSTIPPVVFLVCAVVIVVCLLLVLLAVALSDRAARRITRLVVSVCAINLRERPAAPAR